MMAFRRRAGAITVRHVYYAGRIAARDMWRFAVYYQARVPRTPFGFVAKPFYTIVNALDRPEPEIFKAFTSTVRNEVRRSEREAVRVGFIADPEEFRRFHNTFATAKGTYVADAALIEGYRDNLVITCAKRDDTIVVAHAYLCDREARTARLLLSSSVRLADQADANLVGRANKLLHFRDMMHFKEQGFLRYDFGGFAYNTTDRQRQGINAFKQSFGGTLVQDMDYQSWLYWLSSKLFYRVARWRRRIAGNRDES